MREIFINNAIQEINTPLFAFRHIIISLHNPMNFYHLEDLLDRYNLEVSKIIVQLELKMNLSEIHKTAFQAFKSIYLHKKYFLSITCLN